jgi:hypothetical protein
MHVDYKPLRVEHGAKVLSENIAKPAQGLDELFPVPRVTSKEDRKHHHLGAVHILGKKRKGWRLAQHCPYA